MITILESEPHFALGVGRHILTRITNEGGATWTGGEHGPLIRASYHWRRPDDTILIFDGHRTLLPSAVAPGQSILIPIHVDPPGAEGRYVLEIDLVHEYVRWFECSTKVEVAVAVDGSRPLPRVDKQGISVAICTRDRPDRLRKAIDSILHQDYPQDEIELLIVDNAADHAALRLLATEYEGNRNIRWCREPAVGLSRARNTAVRFATRDIIAFIDDDAVARSTWAHNVVAAFAQFGPQTHALGGCVEPIWEKERPAWLHDDLLGYYSVVDWGGAARHVGPTNWIAGTNMAFRTDMLRAVGFSPELGRRGGDHVLLSNEEQDVLDQVRQRGGLVAYVPQARVGHVVSAERLTQSWLRKRAVWQAISDFMRHGSEFEQTIGQRSEQVRLFQSLTGQSGIAGFGRDFEDPEVLKRQIHALHDLTLVMLAGLKTGPVSSELREHAGSATS